MAINNFIPELWAAKILKERDAKAVLKNLCTTEYSGEIKDLGSRVKINSINYPTVSSYVPGTTSITPEDPKDESRWLEVTQAKYFSVKLDDVEGKQGTKGVMEEVARKGAIALGNTAEAYIGGLYTQAHKTVTDTSVTSADIISKISTARRLLMANNVDVGEDVALVVGPAIFEKIQLAGIQFTDTPDAIKKGMGGYWNEALGCMLYVSNNLTTTVTSDAVVLENCMMFTKEAIGFVEQINKVEMFRPQGDFSEAIKALHLYGAKVIKPKELVALALTTAAETTI